MSLIGVVAILYALTPIRHPLISLPNWSPYLASEQSESILWLPRQQIYFSGSLKYLEITYRKIVNTVIDREHCHTIGLISEEDDWEYPLWVLLSQLPHPQGDGACNSNSHFWADHNRRIDCRPKL